MSEPITTLHLPGKTDKLGESLSALRAFIADVSKRAGLEKHKLESLKLATDEIATNIILYGYGKSNAMGTLDVSATIDDRALTVILEDVAPAFDPFSIPTPDNLDDPLEERGIGGLGIMLARQSVDEFTYVRVGNRNQNRFVCIRPTLSKS
ncbi:MAG: ATP-binding protein [Chloroflexota bacterium]|nr:ATP-binding protein [Chloroflexota bacterium]